jgi:hypothetical protein
MVKNIHGIGSSYVSGEIVEFLVLLAESSANCYKCSRVRFPAGSGNFSLHHRV